LTKIQRTGPKHHIKIALNSQYSLLLSMAMRLGNVAHQHVDIYTKDNNKSLTMSIITYDNGCALQQVKPRKDNPKMQSWSWQGHPYFGNPPSLGAFLYRKSVSCFPSHPLRFKLDSIGWETI
jgi:hypothetical protein